MRFAIGRDKVNGQISPLIVSHKDPGAAETLSQRLGDALRNVSCGELVIVCIGTDRSTGDALGPLVGTNLRHKQIGFPVYGTLNEPVHAMNLHDTMDQIAMTFANPYIIAVDACLGQLSSVGNIQLCSGPVKPGAGVHKELPAVGNIHITGVVNVGGFMEYFVLQNTRLSLVFEMADVISSGLYKALHFVSEAAASSARPDGSLPSLQG